MCTQVHQCEVAHTLVSDYMRVLTEKRGPLTNHDDLQ